MNSNESEENQGTYGMHNLEFKAYWSILSSVYFSGTERGRVNEVDYFRTAQINSRANRGKEAPSRGQQRPTRGRR